MPYPAPLAGRGPAGVYHLDQSFPPAYPPPGLSGALGQHCQPVPHPPELLELELTESVFFDDQSVQVTKARIRDIHALGFHVSLDDFGSGFSSLGMLMEFDVDAIRLDRRFFADMENPKLEGLMASIVELGHKLDVCIVAEGIETQQQVDLLKRVGCDMIQGYFYSRPLPIAEFEAWLNERGEWEAEKPENNN
ncbi:EAL domain-containing protein [Fournierella massiliensis]|nr:EAL domain-containing protein [Fournierella massiliensis]